MLRSEQSDQVLDWFVCLFSQRHVLNTQLYSTFRKVIGNIIWPGKYAQSGKYGKYDFGIKILLKSHQVD